MPHGDPDPGVLDDPRLTEWTEQAVADRLLAGEPPSQAELLGYADAIAALTLVRQIETRTAGLSRGRRRRRSAH